MPECYSIYPTQRRMKALWQVLVVEKDPFDIRAAFHDVPTGARKTLG